MSEYNENLNMVELSDDELEFAAGGKGKKTVYHIKGNHVNVRSGAGTDYPAVAYLNDGDEVVYLGEAKIDKKGNIWGKVSCVGRTGWVRRDLVRK